MSISISAMARHFGVSPCAINYRISRGNLPNPANLTTLEGITYPHSNQPKGPGSKGGTRHTRSTGIIASGRNGLYIMANHYGKSLTNISYYIKTGRLPDPRITPVNLANHPWPQRKKYTKGIGPIKNTIMNKIRIIEAQLDTIKRQLQETNI